LYCVCVCVYPLVIKIQEQSKQIQHYGYNVDISLQVFSHWTIKRLSISSQKCWTCPSHSNLPLITKSMLSFHSRVHNLERQPNQLFWVLFWEWKQTAGYHFLNPLLFHEDAGIAHSSTAKAAARWTLTKNIFAGHWKIWISILRSGEKRHTGSLSHLNKTSVTSLTISLPFLPKFVLKSFVF
jgi:hypothetical protein